MTLGPLDIVIVAAAIATPLVWLPGIAQGRDGIALFNQYLVISVLISMAISQLIATRIASVESIIGRLDQAFQRSHQLECERRISIGRIVE